MTEVVKATMPRSGDKKDANDYHQTPEVVVGALKKGKPMQTPTPTNASIVPADISEALRRIQQWKPPERTHALTVTEPQWLVRDLILSGKVGTIVGSGGSAKTTLLIHLMHCIALGEPWFGFGIDRPGSSVLLSGEDDQEDLDGASAELLLDRIEGLPQAERDRITDLIRQRVRLISLRGVCPTFIAKAGNVFGETNAPRQLVEALRGITDLRLVLPDTLRRFAQASSNDEEAMGKAIKGGEILSEMLPTRPTVAFPHHTSKADFRSGNSDQYSAIGTTAIVDNTRFGLNLREAKLAEVVKEYEMDDAHAIAAEDPETTLIEVMPSRGSLLARKAPPFLVLRDHFHFVRADKGAKTREQKEMDDAMQIVRRVRQLESEGTGKISQNFIFVGVGGVGGIGGKSANRPHRMERAKTLGLVNVDAHGHWSVTGKGLMKLGVSA